MPRIVKAGLIQASHACGTDEKLDIIREANVAKHVELIERAGTRGRADPLHAGDLHRPVLLRRADDAVVRGDGAHSRRADDEADAAAGEEARDGDRRAALRGRVDRRLLQHRRRDRRRRHVPRQVPQESHPALRRRASGRSSTSGPGNLGYPVFKTKYADVGVYICYDRHFPEGARELGLNGAEIVFNPSATVAGLSEYLWKLEQPAHAVANAYFVGAINRVGVEAPWNIGEFYGQSYFCDPRGQFVAQASRDQTELITAELDLDKIREVRNVWQFYRDRRPETYGGLTKL